MIIAKIQEKNRVRKERDYQMDRNTTAMYRKAKTGEKKGEGNVLCRNNVPLSAKGRRG
jgi:hypothetical protein